MTGEDFGLETRKINLIGLKGDEVAAWEIVSKYNLGICKTGVDPESTYTDAAFKRDADDQAISLFRSNWGHEATLKQWIKLQAKYPWPLRMAQGYGLPEFGFDTE